MLHPFVSLSGLRAGLLGHVCFALMLVLGLICFKLHFQQFVFVMLDDMSNTPLLH